MNSSNTAFSELGLSSSIVSSCTAVQLIQPTTIQSHVIPDILAGYNVIGCSKTGTGKTAAYTLPIIHTLSIDPYGIYALILTPTRELVYQIYDTIRILCQSINNIKLCSIIGGESTLLQQQQLSQRPHIIISTPGRLAQHIRNNTATCPSDWKYCKYVVYDEADRLVESNFNDDIQTIIDILPPYNKRQTICMSATMNINHEQLLLLGMDVNDTSKKVVKHNCNEPHNNNVALLNNTLNQSYIFCPQMVKECYLIYLLTESINIELNSVIIFVGTCNGCEFVSQLCTELSITNESLHSHKTQDRRSASLNKFRTRQCNVLICTDVGSRGLDIPHVNYVINYDLPRIHDDYIHRVGRAARAGRSGTAINFISQYDIELFQSIEKYVDCQMNEYVLKEKYVLNNLNDVNKAKHLAKIHITQYDSKNKLVPEKRYQLQQQLYESESNESISNSNQMKIQKKHKTK